MDPALRLVELGEIPPDRREILRYAQLPNRAPAPETLPLEECLAQIRGRVRCRAVWRQYPLKISPSGLDLGFAQTESKSLARRLEGCQAILLFACTAGAEMDRLIARGKLLSPVRGLLLHAIGAQQVEGACDKLCAALAAEFPGWELTERFSPGFGDLPLELQRQLTQALDCPRTLGISLGESLLMTPSKSVTAIIGMKEREAV